MRQYTPAELYHLQEHVSYGSHPSPLIPQPKREAKLSSRAAYGQDLRGIEILFASFVVGTVAGAAGGAWIGNKFARNRGVTGANVWPFRILGGAIGAPLGFTVVPRATMFIANLF